MEVKSRVDKIISVIFWFSLCVHTGTLILGKTVFSTWRFSHDPIHAIVEISGSLIAFYVAIVLLQQEKQGVGTSFNVSISLALICMGLFDGLHAFFHAGKSFVFFHSFATFLGGLFFSSILLENKYNILTSRKSYNFAIVITLLSACIFLIFPELIPEMVLNGDFTKMAIFFNLTGGSLLLLSAIKIFFKYRELKNTDDLLFVLHTALFGLAGLLFQESKLWDFSWWSWHILRLGAYITAFYFAYKQQAVLHYQVIAAIKKKDAQARFLANMGHEIRTPLNGITGMTDALISELSEKTHIEKANIILQSSKQLLKIVNDILDFSKIEAQKIKIEIREINLTQTLLSLESFYKSCASRKSLRFEFELGAEVPKYVLTDELRLQQILHNLLNNAVKFTETGTIQFFVRFIDSDMMNSKLFIDIIDTGIGISKEEINNLFEEFSQADESISRRFGGTGLGLAISKKMISLMGGKITVSSTVGEGTHFKLEVPCQRVVSPKMVGNQKQNICETPNLSGWSILLVEDNVINQKVMKSFLKKTSAKILTVSNGKLAVDALENQMFDIILMDYHMPIMDGVEATRRIVDKYGDQRPVIFALTASTLQEDIDLCFSVGMDEFLSKPVNKELLFNLLKKYQQS